MLQAVAGDGGQAPGLVDAERGAGRARRPTRRRHRIPLGAARRRPAAHRLRSDQGAPSRMSTGAGRRMSTGAKSVIAIQATASIAVLLGAMLLATAVGTVGVSPGEVVGTLLSHLPLLHVHTSASP